MDDHFRSTLSEIKLEIHQLGEHVSEEHQRWKDHVELIKGLAFHDLRPNERCTAYPTLNRRMCALESGVASLNERVVNVRIRRYRYDYIDFSELFNGGQAYSTHATETGNCYLDRILSEAEAMLSAEERAVRNVEVHIGEDTELLLTAARYSVIQLAKWLPEIDMDPEGMVRAAQGLVWSLKFAMSEIGMRVARQRFITEFFTDGLAVPGDEEARRRLAEIFGEMSWGEEGDAMDVDGGVEEEPGQVGVSGSQKLITEFFALLAEG